MNSDLRRKNNTHKKQAKVLVDERAELEVALRDKEVEVEKVKNMISEQERFEEQRAAVRAAIAEQRRSEEVSVSEFLSPVCCCLVSFGFCSCSCFLLHLLILTVVVVFFFLPLFFVP